MIGLARSAVFLCALGLGNGGMQTPAAPDDAPLRARTLALLDRLIPAAEAALHRDGSDPADVRGLARRLGDVESAFRFVRDEIEFEPYDGALRGAAGALLARRANSFDKALLLHGMLEALGHRSRIVQGTLDDAAATQLVDEFLARTPPTQPNVGADQAIADAARTTGLSTDALTQVTQRNDRAASSLIDDVSTMARAHATALLAAIRRGQAAQGAFATMRDAAVATVRRHAFVQWMPNAARSEEWRDLDATPAATQDGTSRATDAKLPLELSRHRLRFELRYATRAATTTILDVTTDVADALAQPLRFQVTPADEAPGITQVSEMTPDQLRKLLASRKRFQATLSRGAVQHASRAFDLDGALYDVTTDGRVQGASDLGRGLQRGLGGLTGGESAPAPEFVSLELVTTLRAPNGTDRTFVRTLLDTAAKARGELPITQWEILAAGGPLGGEWIARTDLAARLPMWRAARTLLTVEPERVTGSLAAVLAAADTEQPLTLLRVQAAREAQFARIGQIDGVRAWSPEPQVLVYERRLGSCADDGACATERFDWMASDTHVLPRDREHADAAFATALEFGCFDTVVEAMLLERAAPTAVLASAAHALEAARSDGRELRVSDTRTADGRVRIEIADSRVVYEVDPRFGSSVGRLPSGHGGASATVVPQALAEYAKVLRPIFWFYACLIPNLIAADRGTKSGAKLGFAIVGCMVGMSVRFTGMAMGFAGRKGAELVLGFLGDAISGAFGALGALG
jgi:hypothetical protein